MAHFPSESDEPRRMSKTERYRGAPVEHPDVFSTTAVRESALARLHLFRLLEVPARLDAGAQRAVFALLFVLDFKLGVVDADVVHRQVAVVAALAGGRVGGN